MSKAVQSPIDSTRRAGPRPMIAPAAVRRLSLLDIRHLDALLRDLRTKTTPR